MDWIDLAVAGAFESGNEPLGSIKCGEFLDRPKTCYLLMASAPWRHL